MRSMKIKSISILLLFLIVSLGSSVAAADQIGNPRTADNGIATWDCVFFGNYYQTSSDAKEPIKWRVLSVNGNDAFLIADQNLDCYPYYPREEVVTWEHSSLRAWLNDSFLNAAFKENEKAAIPEVTVVNHDFSNSSGGNDTRDRIFLLSVDEASNPDYGFINNLARGSKNTAYTVSKGAYQYVYNPRIVWSTSPESKYYDGNGYWWLRSPGWVGTIINVAGVSYSGSINANAKINDDDTAVRPCLHLDMQKPVWSYAGTVSSDGTFTCAEHTWDDGKVTKEPTNDADGERTYVCTICGTEKVEVIPKLTPILTPTPTPATSTTHTFGNLVYSLKGSSATVIGPASKTVTSLTIPTSIKVSSKSYKVTAIKKDAFKEMIALKSVVIGKNVKSIGKQSFYGCSNLKTITMKTKKLSSVGSNAFKGIYKKAKVVCPSGYKAKYKKLLLTKGMKTTVTFK